MNFNRNGSMNNIHNVEKTMQKYQQLAKDAQSNGDPVLAQNYLQHADHYLRRYNELNDKRENLIEKTTSEDKSQSKEKSQNRSDWQWLLMSLISHFQNNLIIIVKSAFLTKAKRIFYMLSPRIRFILKQWIRS